MSTVVKKRSLKKMRELMEILGNPQDDLKFVHIVGTNGKGSTAAFISSALVKAGYKTGLYTSPYLQKFNERIRVNGKCIPDKDLEEIFSQVDLAGRKMEIFPSEFERVTAAGFLYFKKVCCDIVVLEAGVGGLMDSTNIIKTGEVSVITAIGFDHTDKLGNTLEEITEEKSGAIKENRAVIVSDQDEKILSVIRKQAESKNSEIIISEGKKAEIKSFSMEGQNFHLPSHGDFFINLLGRNQVENASSAVEALKALRKRGFDITDENIKDGLRDTLWAGRFELVAKEPAFILDCGHNVNCMESLIENIKTYFPDKEPVVLTGVMADKDFSGIYDELDRCAKAYVAVNCDYERALPAEDLSKFLEKYGKKVYDFPIMEEGIRKAVSLAKELDTFVLATGSVYICGDIRTILTNEEEVPVYKG